MWWTVRGSHSLRSRRAEPGTVNVRTNPVWSIFIKSATKCMATARHFEGVSEKIFSGNKSFPKEIPSVDLWGKNWIFECYSDELLFRRTRPIYTAKHIMCVEIFLYGSIGCIAFLFFFCLNRNSIPVFPVQFDPVLDWSLWQCAHNW
jgi:hypothetical protein